MYADLFQTVIMYGVLILIVMKGTFDVGGLSTVIERNVNSGRIEYPEYKIF